MMNTVFLPSPLHLQSQEKALRNRVIPIVTFAAHTTYQAMLDHAVGVEQAQTYRLQGERRCQALGLVNV